MSSLTRDERKALERVVLAARKEAEAGARRALEALAVEEPKPHKAMAAEQQQLRARLRAHGRQLGDKRNENGGQETKRLVEECAYEHWHRLLFARFLGENELLVEPESGEPLTLGLVKDLAQEKGEDWVDLASRFAEVMLPQIFRTGDPALALRLPLETRQVLEQKLEELPPETFRAEDALGWVYQFWQSERKDEVNASEKKIGADELAAVTQLFTEDYMVLFLLHNTLGAWWAAKRKEAGKDHQLPGYEWTYLRFKDDGTPAAGAYEGWPREAKAVTVLDPCMGSGHFLVFALPILVGMRMEEEGLAKEAAIDAVLAENIYGLELDPRCTQIAAFNLALAAWKMGGYRPLPSLNLACSGLGINAKEEEWVKLAGKEPRLKEAMRELYRLFERAPILGSLIDPKQAVKGDLLTAGFEEVKGLLEKALTAEEGDEARGELAVTAKGLLKAAELLGGSFTLVATNPPYLGRGKQCAALRMHCEKSFPSSKADLSTCFVERAYGAAGEGGTCALVLPQNWLFLGVFKRLRKSLLGGGQLNALARLGPAAFHDMNWWAATTSLVALSRKPPHEEHEYFSVSAAETKNTEEKSRLLRVSALRAVQQSTQFENPDWVIIDDAVDRSRILGAFAGCYQGIGTADISRFVACFFELPSVGGSWEPYQMAPESGVLFSGCHSVLRWEEGRGELAHSERARVCGQPAWGRVGVAASVTGAIYRSLFFGTKFDCTAATVVPVEPSDDTAVIAFVLDPQFPSVVRGVDQALSVTESSFLKAPFDVEHWRKVAAEKYPHGLPQPHSDDPTQWLFSGHPKGSEAPLHVAVARLVGYRWPRQTGSSFMDCPALGPDGLEPFADADGIVCLAPLRGELSASDRLKGLLAKAYGSEWKATKLSELLKQVEADSLEEWLRNEFFKQHCEVFHQRPFVWQIWDGVKNGFSALVNYHKLAGSKGEGRRTLESLVYAYLGDWISKQKAAVKDEVDGAELKLAAAEHLKRELEKILEGEPPYDIFVRWKPLSEQPVGWDPDVNDGVRVNIRPFMSAAPANGRGCLLRTAPKITWGKDKGKEPERPKAEYPWLWGWNEKAQDFAGGRFDGRRWNDLHYSTSMKEAARPQTRKARG